MRQLYIKLKDLIHKIVGKYHGPWDYILLRDTTDPERIYKVYVTEGNLRSQPTVEIPEPEPSSSESNLLETDEP